MHDPLVVAFKIPRPWPKRTARILQTTSRWSLSLHSPFWRLFGHEFYWPALITVWHREPGGADSGSVCKHFVTTHSGGRRPDNLWRWHFWHWRIQVHPTQALKRRLWTRCAECGRSFRRGEVTMTTAWDGPGPRWFRGEPNVLHDRCHSLRALRARAERWEHIVRLLVAWVELATGRPEARIVELVTSRGTSWTWQEQTDFARALGYQLEDGHWQKPPVEQAGVGGSTPSMTTRGPA